MRVGIDLVEIERIEKMLENSRFLKRVFSEKELVEFEKHGYKPESIAGAFAAKEAFSKCLGTGVRGFSLNEISLLHNDFGAPFLELEGRAKVVAEEQNLTLCVSISHTKDTAAAVVVVSER